jgi:hypothetical protein
MPPISASILVPGGATELALLALLAAVLIAGGVWLFLSSRQTAAQRERRRRLAINKTGRMGDAMIIDVRDCVLYYSYEIRGVEYTTSQDASDFRDLLPRETAGLIGPVGMKFAPKNPANSIVICEDWSGLRSATLQFQETEEKDRS